MSLFDKPDERPERAPETGLRTDPERERIVFGAEVDWSETWGGTKRFKGLTPADGWRLIRNGYMHQHDKQNAAPRARWFVEFGAQLVATGVAVTLHGYMVEPRRPDARVTIEGLRAQGPIGIDYLAEFATACRDADEYNAGKRGLFCWFD